MCFFLNLRVSPLGFLLVSGAGVRVLFLADKQRGISWMARKRRSFQSRVAKFFPLHTRALFYGHQKSECLAAGRTILIPEVLFSEEARSWPSTYTYTGTVCTPRIYFKQLSRYMLLLMYLYILG